MKIKKWLALAMTACLITGLAGCAANGPAVYVQSVGDITGMGSIALGDRFPGMVVSENVTEIQKDSDKSIEELFVKEGEDVAEGQELFSYDTEELQLNLDKQRLELEQLEATIENYKQQIADLEEDREDADEDDQLQYTVQIQSLQVDLKEAELSVQAKQKEIEQSEKIMGNAVVAAPISGRIQSINESGTDSYGNPSAYITIQQAGSYRVQGTIGELQMGTIMEGTRMKIISRTDENKVWYGTVSLVDYENATQGNDNDYYYGMITDSMTTTSKYPFYIELDDLEGLILGQHVYLEVDMGEDIPTGLQLPGYFICYDEAGAPYVWAENSGRLEMRALTLGAYNDMMGTWEVTAGLSEADYIAFPDPELCVAGAPTTREIIVEDVESGVE